MKFDWDFQNGGGILEKIPPSLWWRILSELHNSFVLSSSLVVLSVFAPEKRFLFQDFNPSSDT